LDLSAVGIAQIVAHAVFKSIFCHEEWRHGSSQMTGEDLLLLHFLAEFYHFKYFSSYIQFLICLSAGCLFCTFALFRSVTVLVLSAVSFCSDVFSYQEFTSRNLALHVPS